MFGAHAAACRDGTLPAFDAGRAFRGDAVGKAIVFAREDVRPLRTGSWLEHAWVRDVPRSAVPIAKGRPICTVFATGATTRECHEGLAARAAAIYRMV
jgi:predicted ATP-grasp superfamily ATP-dependent carboligase